MANKSLKLRISKVISTTLQSCRSTHPSDLPEEPLPPPLFQLSPKYSKLITVDYPVINRLPSRMKAGAHHLRPMSSSDPTISSAFIRSYSKSTEFKWRKEEKWHVIAKFYDETHTVPARRKKASSKKTKNVDLLALPPPAPAPPSPSSSGRKKRHEKMKKNPTISTFSAQSERFSNEVGDERSEEGTEALVENFSIDSSIEINSNLEGRNHKRSKIRKSKNRSKQSTQSIEIIHRQSSVSSTAEIGSPVRLSMFKKLIPCSVDGKVKESFAIVKKSEDPYEDFKRSMVEMILEKQIFEEEDLEQLLQCFLSLNSTQYHILIFIAFSEIWEAMLL